MFWDLRIGFGSKQIGGGGVGSPFSQKLRGWSNHESSIVLGVDSFSILFNHRSFQKRRFFLGFRLELLQLLVPSHSLGVPLKKGGNRSRIGGWVVKREGFPMQTLYKNPGLKSANYQLGGPSTRTRKEKSPKAKPPIWGSS